MPFLVRKQTTATNMAGDSNVYFPGEVISDHEISDVIKEKIRAGISWYTQTYEPLTDTEARSFRTKATTAEGARVAPNGQKVDPPFPDYVGLHPDDVLKKMEKLPFAEVENVRQYERAGLNRPTIIEFVAPSEREPWHGYSEDGIREILEKMSLYEDDKIQEIITYEMHHQKRPAVLEYEAESYEPQKNEQLVPAGAEE